MAISVNERKLFLVYIDIESPIPPTYMDWALNYQLDLFFEDEEQITLCGAYPTKDFLDEAIHDFLIEIQNDSPYFRSKVRDVRHAEISLKEFQTLAL